MSRLDRVLTARLVLTRIRLEDADEVRLLHEDARVMATLGGVRTADETRAELDVLTRHWDAHGYGPWIAREASGTFVGMGGLREVNVGGAPEVEIGYALRPDFWGQGLATELARASVRAAFDVLRLPAIVSFALPANAPSRRVMEKAGFRYEREVLYKGRPHVLYRQTAARWRGSSEPTG